MEIESEIWKDGSKFGPSIPKNPWNSTSPPVGICLAYPNRMARPPRFLDPQFHYHVIARCNNRAFHLQSDEDFLAYLSTLRLVQRKHQFRLFNYELMNSHVHLFIQPGPEIPFFKTMQLINWKYTMAYNRRKQRKGHFWMDRYQCVPVESDRYALALMRYINRNPVRAGMVEKAGDWKWSGYRFYAEGEANEILTPHPTYLATSQNPLKRQEAYKNFVNEIEPEMDRRDPQFTESPYLGSQEFGKWLDKKRKGGTS